jgi:hypothetical protein
MQAMKLPISGAAAAEAGVEAGAEAGGGAKAQGEGRTQQPHLSVVDMM